MITNEQIADASCKVEKFYLETVCPKLKIANDMALALASMYDEPLVAYVERNTKCKYVKCSLMDVVDLRRTLPFKNRENISKFINPMPSALVSIFGYSTLAFANFAKLVQTYTFENQVAMLRNAKKLVDELNADLDLLIEKIPVVEEFINRFYATLHEEEQKIDLEFNSLFGKDEGKKVKKIRMKVEYEAV